MTQPLRFHPLVCPWCDQRGAPVRVTAVEGSREIGYRMELKDYSIVLRRRWRTIGACVVIVIAIAAALTWSATPLYSSTARLFISTSSSSNSGAAYTGELFASMRAAS